jgi:hypothetical protein
MRLNQLRRQTSRAITNNRNPSHAISMRACPPKGRVDRRPALQSSTYQTSPGRLKRDAGRLVGAQRPFSRDASASRDSSPMGRRNHDHRHAAPPTPPSIPNAAPFTASTPPTNATLPRPQRLRTNNPNLHPNTLAPAPTPATWALRPHPPPSSPNTTPSATAIRCACPPPGGSPLTPPATT